MNQIQWIISGCVMLFTALVYVGFFWWESADFSGTKYPPTFQEEYSELYQDWVTNAPNTEINVFRTPIKSGVFNLEDILPEQIPGTIYGKSDFPATFRSQFRLENLQQGAYFHSEFMVFAYVVENQLQLSAFWRYCPNSGNSEFIYDGNLIYEIHQKNHYRVIDGKSIDPLSKKENGRPGLAQLGVEWSKFQD